MSGAVHLLYHFKTAGNAVPFVYGGGGLGNAVGIAAKEDMNVRLVRAGAGVKCFFGRPADEPATSLPTMVPRVERSGGALGDLSQSPPHEAESISQTRRHNLRLTSIVESASLAA